MHFLNCSTRSAAPCALREVPSGASGALGVNFLIFFLARKFDDTSVTRSFTRGNALIGSTVIGSATFSSLRRVMHIKRGFPLISAEHDPHFPALQFQRTARSLTCSAWLRCMACRQTM